MTGIASIRFRIVAPVAALLLAACSQSAAPPAVDTAAAAEAVKQLDGEWVQRYADRDMEWITDLHAADAVQLPPGSDIIEGNAAIGQAWQDMTEVFPQATWEPIKVQVAGSGDMAYLYGRATATTPDGTDVPMKFMEVWVKVNGEWKVAADMFNANE